MTSFKTENNNNRAYKMKYHIALLSLLCSAALITPIHAKTPSLSQMAAQELSNAIENDGFELELSGGTKIFPDNRMMYTVSFQNTGYKSSDEIDITSPVPPETVYIPDSADGENCDILFSVDGGETWGTPEELKIKDKSGDWETASAGDYTHIKWLYKPELRPAEVQQVSFQVRMR